MGSLFLNTSLVAGVALAAIPVVLHLLLKQTPKHVVFPALRLLRHRQERTTQRLRIKNWLLLLARMALLALMALALARPRFDAKVAAGDENVESAMALVFDTSLSMAYTEQGRSRLDDAKTLAEQLLQRTHTASDVYVLNSGRPAEPARLSPAAARSLIATLEIEPANQPLNTAISLAAQTVAQSDKPRREVFVLTDLTRSAWNPTETIRLDARTDRPDSPANSVALYLLNLGPPDNARSDAAITRVEPANSLVGQDEPLPIRAFVRATGQPARRIAEFFVDGQKRDQKAITVPAGSEAEIPVFSPRFGPGLHRVEIRLSGESDPLPANDAYFLTFDVHPAVKVLVLADSALDAQYVANAIDPEILRNRDDAPRPYHVELRLTGELDLDRLRRELPGFASVFLLNVERPAPALWQALSDYLRQGGGLVIGVGDRVAADLDAYNATPEAQALLPASLGRLRSHPEMTFGRLDIGSALFAPYAQELASELARVPIYKSLLATPVEGARVLLAYEDDSPALIERLVTNPEGTPAGRVLLWTTALTRVPQVNASWNEFPIADWSFFYLMNQTVPYLAGRTELRLHVEAGETVTLPLDSSSRILDISAQPPGRTPPIRLSEPAPGRPLSISTRLASLKADNLLGFWSVTLARQNGQGQILGFSVNPPTAEADLTQIDRASLDALLGPDRYKLATNIDDLNRQVQETTIGREAFPWLMLLILLLVTLENFLANRFYRDRPQTPAATPTRALARAS
ncbi:MAG: hypothetical protein KatS3mg108_2058 [Isosphaeraceae bacterium]|jgi:hypothetical protein|nr:MAG: hypothetical protein KatS3mg108_2058 [Isosphaeraceae bacterium]